MLVNLSDVFTIGQKVEEREMLPALDCFEQNGTRYDVVAKEPVVFTFTNLEPEKVKVSGTVDITFRAVCDRCLADVPVRVRTQVERYVVSPKLATEQDVQENPFMDGYQIDLETLLFHEILENWPVKILCKEDCKGVCPVCGQNLNEKECGCDRFVPDPRMAEIADMLNRNKEV